MWSVLERGNFFIDVSNIGNYSGNTVGTGRTYSGVAGYSSKNGNNGERVACNPPLPDETVRLNDSMEVGRGEAGTSAGEVFLRKALKNSHIASLLLKDNINSRTFLDKNMNIMMVQRKEGLVELDTSSNSIDDHNSGASALKGNGAHVYEGRAKGLKDSEFEDKKTTPFDVRRRENIPVVPLADCLFLAGPSKSDIDALVSEYSNSSSNSHATFMGKSVSTSKVAPHMLFSTSQGTYVFRGFWKKFLKKVCSMRS